MRVKDFEIGVEVFFIKYLALDRRRKALNIFSEALRFPTNVVEKQVIQHVSSMFV